MPSTRPLPHTYGDYLADSIVSRLTELAKYLTLQSPSPEVTARVLARVLDPEDGVLGSFTGLMAAGSRFAQNQAERGLLPAEVWLALGRADNELAGIGVDLEEHTELLTSLRVPPAGDSTSAAKPPGAVPLVVRRHR